MNNPKVMTQDVKPLKVEIEAESPDHVNLQRIRLNCPVELNQTRQELIIDANLDFIITLSASEFNYERLQFKNKHIELNVSVNIKAFTPVTKDDLIEILRQQFKDFEPEIYVLDKEVDNFKSAILSMHEVHTQTPISSRNDLYRLSDRLLKKVRYNVKLSV